MLTMYFYRGMLSFELSILFGTIAGLPLRYILEKRYIFSFKSKNLSHDSQLFILYGFMSFFTTVLFWITEYTFNWIFATSAMTYLGGVVGLSVGYYIKYQLDKKFVFIDNDKGKKF